MVLPGIKFGHNKFHGSNDSFAVGGQMYRQTEFICFCIFVQKGLQVHNSHNRPDNYLCMHMLYTYKNHTNILT